jgi:hypothetical protein
MFEFWADVNFQSERVIGKSVTCGQWKGNGMCNETCFTIHVHTDNCVCKGHSIQETCVCYTSYTQLVCDDRSPGGYELQVELCE